MRCHPPTTATPPSIDSHYAQSYISTTCNPSPSVRPHMRGPAIRTDLNARWWGGSKLNTITRLSELSKRANGRAGPLWWLCWLRLHFIALFTAYLNPNESLTLHGSWDRSNLNSGIRRRPSWPPVVQGLCWQIGFFYGWRSKGGLWWWWMRLLKATAYKQQRKTAKEELP